MTGSEPAGASPGDSQLAALLEVSHSLASTLDAKAITGVVLDQLKSIIDYGSAAITVVEEDSVRIVDGRPGAAVGTYMKIDHSLDVWRRLRGGRRRREPVVINDTQGDDELAVSLREMFAAGGLSLEVPRVIRSWMNIPMAGHSGVIGGLVITHPDAGFFTPEHVGFALAFANQAAVAIENARLYSQLEQRTRELSTLVDISRSVSSTLDLETVVDTILDQLRTVVLCDAAAVTVVEGTTATLLALHRGDARVKLPAGTVPIHELPSGERIVSTGAPLLLHDTDKDEAMSRWLRDGARNFNVDMSAIRSSLGVPLITRDGVIGWLSVGHEDPNHFGERDIELTQAFANQVAVAISNARFHEQSQEFVVIEERQRIARDLHDSVSQALYSILLTGSAARTLADSRPEAVADPLDTVISLAEGGLAEMRALIFELRPESLEQEGLVVAIEKRAAALRARHSLEVVLSLCEEPEASLEVKEAISRIAQEALHNIVKHAEATRVEIGLRVEAGALRLEIRDDGNGFDVDSEFAGHLGLVSMRERTSALGGSIDIASRSGEGTEINVVVELSGNTH